MARDTSFTRGYEGLHTEGVRRGGSERRRDEAPLVVPGVSRDTARLLEKLGSGVGLDKKRLAAVFGGSVPAPATSKRATLGRSGSAIVGGRKGKGRGASASARAKTVRVPRVGNRRSLPDPSELHRPARRPAHLAAADVRDIERDQDAVARSMRAPNAKRHIDSHAKSVLQDGYLKGTGRRPGAAPAAPGLVPAGQSLKAHQARARRTKKFEDLEAKGHEPVSLSPQTTRPPSKSRNAVLFDQIASEIEDRQRFLIEMRSLGQADTYEEKVGKEIELRMTELKRIEELMAMGS